MISERHEDGKRITLVDAAEEFGQVLDQMDNYRIEIEAPKEIIEAFGIFDSDEELGIEPDDEGVPWNRDAYQAVVDGLTTIIEGAESVSQDPNRATKSSSETAKSQAG